MNRKILIAGAAALLLAACGQKQTEGQLAEQAATPDANPAATVLTPADETKAGVFVDKATAGNMYEIEAGKIAVGKSTNAEVKKFAQMMIDAHTKTAMDMQKAIAASGLAIMPVKTPTPTMAKMLEELTVAKVADFDKIYADAQVDAHQNQLNLLQHYANAGDNKSLQDFATATAPTVQDHLNTAEAIKKGLQ